MFAVTETAVIRDTTKKEVDKMEDNFTFGKTNFLSFITLEIENVLNDY